MNTDRLERIERPVLYLLVLVLAAALGYFALKPESGGKKDEQEPSVAATDDAPDDLGPTVADAADQDNVVGLEERIADAAANKLLTVGYTPTGAGECAETPCPRAVVVDSDDSPSITLNSRFIFFYENARLNDDRQVTADSFGVKPARRYLELLANAFQPCHRADTPVEFAVAGYSSVAEFRVQTTGETVPESNELNLNAANLRAQIIGDYLQDQGFRVETKQWSENDLQRPYPDDVQSRVDPQALNRAVFIDLKSAGACDLVR